MRIVILVVTFLAFVQNQLRAIPEGKLSAVRGDDAVRSSLERKIDYLCYEGFLLHESGRYDAAYEIFTYCLSLDSTVAIALVSLSSYHMRMNNHAKAIEYLQKAVSYQPHNYTYNWALAMLYLDRSMYAEAVGVLENLALSNPGKFEINYLLAEAETRLGNLEKAIEQYNKIEETTGMNEGLSSQKFRLYMTLKSPERAFREIHRLAEKYPGDARYQTLLGDLYMDTDTALAMSYYQKAFEMDPGDPGHALSMINFYERSGDVSSTEEYVKQALINDRLDGEIKAELLNRYVNQVMQSPGHDISGVNSLFQTLLSQHPDDIELKLIYGSLLLAQNNYDDAQFQFQLVTELDPDNEQAWRQLLNACLKSQDAEKILSVCERARVRFPEASLYLYCTGLAYQMQEDFDKAIASFRAGLELVAESNPMERSEFYAQIGNIYSLQRRWEETYESYERALEFNEQNVTVLNNYAYFLSLYGGDLQKAERMSGICIKLDPENAVYLDTYAWIYFMQGNYVLARIYIEKAIANDTSLSGDLFDHYGDILYMSGDHEGAIRQWERAIEAGKSNATLQRKVAEKIYINTPEDEK